MIVIAYPTLTDWMMSVGQGRQIMVYTAEHITGEYSLKRHITMHLMAVESQLVPTIVCHWVSYGWVIPWTTDDEPFLARDKGKLRACRTATSKTKAMLEDFYLVQNAYVVNGNIGLRRITAASDNPYGVELKGEGWEVVDHKFSPPWDDGVDDVTFGPDDDEDDGLPF